MRLRDNATLQLFDDYFARADIEFVPLTRAVLDCATRLRSELNFKLGDAVHVAAAIESGCDVFLTNDTRLSRCTDIAVEVLP